MSDDVREEAERLVAAALAAASFALRNAGHAATLAGMAERFFGGERIATSDSAGSRTAAGEPAPSSPECCICPVCRGIAALRDPSPEFAAKLASGASDLAAGLTTILRAVNSATARPRPEPAPPRPPEPGPTWRAATRTEDWPRPEPAEPDEHADPWHAATTAAAPPPRKIAKKAVKKAAPAPEDPA
jgi:hypothetical protein